MSDEQSASDDETVVIPGAGWAPCPDHAHLRGPLADVWAVVTACPACTTWGAP